jgi:hypothetical protein
VITGAHGDGCRLSMNVGSKILCIVWHKTNTAK